MPQKLSYNSGTHAIGSSSLSYWKLAFESCIKSHNLVLPYPTHGLGCIKGFWEEMIVRWKNNSGSVMDWVLTFADWVQINPFFKRKIIMFQIKKIYIPVILWLMTIVILNMFYGILEIHFCSINYQQIYFFNPLYFPSHL